MNFLSVILSGALSIRLRMDRRSRTTLIFPLHSWRENCQYAATPNTPALNHP